MTFVLVEIESNVLEILKIVSCHIERWPDYHPKKQSDGW